MTNSNAPRGPALFSAAAVLMSMFSLVDLASAQQDDGADGHAGFAPMGPPKAPTLTLTQEYALELVPAPSLQLGPIDVAALMIEDDRTPQPAPLRFAIPRLTEVDLADGQWISVEGGRVWRLEISGEEATCARLHLSGVALGAKQRLFIVSPDIGWSVGPIDGVGQFDNGEVWGLFAPGARTRLEWFVPSGTRATRLPWETLEYCHGYREVFEPEQKADGGLAGGCENQPACYAAWANESNATVKLLQGGGALCSGQLIATTTADQTPYCATAAHCVSTQSVANSLQFVFFNRANTCGGAAAAGTTVTGSDLTDTYGTADGTLLMLRGEIPATTYWVGWLTTNPTSGTASTCLHHPSGAPQAISFGSKTSTNNFCGTGSYWSVVSWTDGVTEPGSSGSAIYRDSDHKMFGTLTCGGSSCSQQTLDDGYGRFDSAYLASGGNYAAFLTAGSDDAQEQNDTCATAKPVTATSYTALVVKSTDEDWYSMSIPSGTQASFALTFTDANGDIDMQLYNSCGGTVVASQAGNGNNEALSYTNTGATATFYLRVFLYSDTRNDYSMTVSTVTPAPANDNCAGAVAIGNANTAFNTSSATTSTPALPTTCTDGAGSAIYRDVWYRYTASCAGVATASTCGTASFDTRLAVYTGTACPTATTAIACDDNTTGCAANTTSVSWAVTAGSTWYVRVGAPANVGGTGTLTTSCVVPCPADLNNTGAIDGSDLALMLVEWGGAGVADLNGSGVVDAADLGMLLAAWGPCS